MNFNNWKLVYSELVKQKKERKKKTLVKAKPQQQTSEVSRILESFRQGRPGGGWYTSIPEKKFAKIPKIHSYLNT